MSYRFPTRFGENAVSAELHPSITYVIDGCRYIPVPETGGRKTEFFNSLLIRYSSPVRSLSRPAKGW